MDLCHVFFFKPKTAYEMLISYLSSDVCSSDLWSCNRPAACASRSRRTAPTSGSGTGSSARAAGQTRFSRPLRSRRGLRAPDLVAAGDMAVLVAHRGRAVGGEEDRAVEVDHVAELPRSEEHTSELQSLMRISYAVFCLKKNTPTNNNT